MEILELGVRRILRSGNSSRLSMDRRVTSRESEGGIVSEVGVKLMGLDGVDGVDEVDGVDGVDDGSQSEA